MKQSRRKTSNLYKITQVKRNYTDCTLYKPTDFESLLHNISSF